MIAIKRHDIKLVADATKVILKFLDFGSEERITPVWKYIEAMEESEAEIQLASIYKDFEHRHFNLKLYFENIFQRLGEPFNKSIFSETKKLLLGAYFTHEYSVEASAFFNPAIVPFDHPKAVDKGCQGFILSMRSTGEGHVSSIAFLTGVINSDGSIQLDERQKKLATPSVIISADNVQNYAASFDQNIAMNSRILFPTTPDESNGMEDARFVLFKEDGDERYIATYTAYNGRSIHPKCIETSDFKNFKITSFTGAAASDKGFALFPEKINGKYAMIGRQGGRCMSIMYTENLYHWENYKTLQVPMRSWELLQMGNCGSPIKTIHGWLLLTHAVGHMRKYVISMSLLDLHDPSIVIASLDEPLLSPNEDERDGYVPNVLYTCGMMLHGDELIIPYAMSDSAVGFATVKVEEIINQMTKSKARL